MHSSSNNNNSTSKDDEQQNQQLQHQHRSNTSSSITSEESSSLMKISPSMVPILAPTATTTSDEETTSHHQHQNSKTFTTATTIAIDSSSKNQVSKNHHEQHHNEKEQEPEDSSTSITKAEREKMESFSFFTPNNVLIIFTLVNFFIYVDRGVPASAVSYIRVDKDITGGDDEPSLTQEESGYIYSAFMVGFLIFNPVFVALSGLLASNRIILIGMFSWCIAVALAGAASSYNQLLLARCITGVGEAAFIPFSVTVIDNIAPKGARSFWLSIFYATIPFGNALGILVSGIVSDATWFDGEVAGWRMMFYLESIPMVVLLCICVLLPREFNVRREHRVDDEHHHREENHHGNAEQQEEEMKEQNSQHQQQQQKNGNNESNKEETNKSSTNNKSHIDLLDALRMLILENKFYVIATIGSSAYTFVLGALSFFAVTMLVESNFDVTTIQASILLGITTSVMGFFGSVIGGKIVDNMKGGSVGFQGMYNSTWLMTISLVVSIPLGFLALAATNFTLFCIYFVVTVFFVFLITAPMSALILSIVQPQLRTYAIAVNTMAIHVLGDSFSPTLTGYLADSFDGGCSSFDSNQTLCEEHVLSSSSSDTSSSCKFLASQSVNEKSSCVNPNELFEAMKIIWIGFLIALPAWFYLMKEFKKNIPSEIHNNNTTKPQNE